MHARLALAHSLHEDLLREAGCHRLNAAVRSETPPGFRTASRRCCTAERPRSVMHRERCRPRAAPGVPASAHAFRLARDWNPKSPAGCPPQATVARIGARRRLSNWQEAAGGGAPRSDRGCRRLTPCARTGSLPSRR